MLRLVICLALIVNLIDYAGTVKVERRGGGGRSSGGRSRGSSWSRSSTTRTRSWVPARYTYYNGAVVLVPGTGGYYGAYGGSS